MRGQFFVCLVLATWVWLGEAQRRNFSNFPCPPRCYCFKRTVRCMKLDLQDVPRTAFLTATLDLRFNKITQIPKGTFRNNRNVVSLLLDNNLLKSLNDGMFDGLIHVQNLYIHKNRINHIDPRVFQGLKRLERLYLHNNELERFDAGTFSNLPSLDRLYLYNNRLQHIPKGAFALLPKLTRLRLDHNALVCDCQIVWLAKMLTDNSLLGSANCRYPSEMYGKSLIGMNAEDFHCKSLQITEGPQDVQVSWGGSVMFTCKVQDPSASIVWMRDDKELILDNKKYRMVDNGSLLIQNTIESDDGYYECMAKNSDEEVKSRSARMIVLRPEYITQGYGAPRFSVIPYGVSVTPGEAEVTLRCQAVGIPEPSIKWAKNGIRLPSTYKTFYQPDGSLTIRDIDPTDQGSYQCEASNINGRINTEVNVIIKAAPVFTIQPENAETQIGGTVRLECVAAGTPNPEITWLRNEQPLRQGGRIYISTDRTLLQIRDAKESDSSLYICEARNELGSREVSALITVKNLAFKPAKLVYKPYNIEALVGSTIEMPCKSKGDPKPGIAWQKDGATMQRTGRFKVSLSGNLYIYNVTAEDQGRYECTAINDYGRDTASGYLTVKNIQTTTAGGGISNQFIKLAFAEASEEVDRAINKTIDNIINNKGPHSPADLFKIVRYPDAPARELARAAEVYERTLVHIRKHVEKGKMVMNSTSDFDYKEILSPEHLELIARLSGCMTHRLTRNCTDMCFHSKYRSIDGTCNNLQHPTWGASLTAFRRILKPIYEDGFTKPVGWHNEKKYFGYSKPSSRLVSTTLISTNKVTPDPEITHMVMQWGQFLDHDLDHAIPSVTSESWDGVDCKKTCDYAAPCYPMDVPPNDPRVTNRRCIDFIRSSSICGSGMTSVFFDSIQPREQINQLTSYIDASQVYGFSEELARDLRDLNTDSGRLREGPQFPGRKPLLPYAANQGMDCRRNLSESTVNCFVAGDIRANEQAALLAMHTLWMREHNRVARELKYHNPHWDTDMLYHETRKIIGAAMQHLTYKHWLPLILGQKGMDMLGNYEGYNPELNPSISNVFATAALRFGHTLINPVLHRLDWDFKPIREGHLPLSKAFFSPWRVVEEGGVDPLLRGLFTVPAKVKRSDENLNSELTEHLFQTAHAVALDLAAMNIHRSRDHAIPGYTEYRKFCNMTPVDSFNDLKQEISDANIRRKLQELYGHPGNIDIFVGGILEDQIDGAKVGPLFRCLLVEQFKRLRDGDRFYYENPSVFKPEQLVQIKQYTLSRVLCDNGDNITRITKDVFKLPELQDGYMDCKKVPKVELKFWTECCSDCRYSGQLNTISRLNTRRNRRHLDEFSFSNTTTHEAKDEIVILKTKVSDLEKELNSMKNKLMKVNKIVKQLERRLSE